jgi:hypothetical protein
MNLNEIASKVAGDEIGKDRFVYFWKWFFQGNFKVRLMNQDATFKL